MRFQVPQFIDIEDKVIGPFTLKQFSYYLVAILTLTVLYTIVDLGLLITLAVPLLGAAALFAHGRFYGQPFGSVLVNGIGFYTTKRMWLWKRREKVETIHLVGPEYDELVDIGQYSASALTLMAQVLATEGNIISEDAADPFLEDAGEAALVTQKEGLDDPRLTGSSSSIA